MTVSGIEHGSDTDPVQGMHRQSPRATFVADVVHDMPTGEENDLPSVPNGHLHIRHGTSPTEV